MRAIRYRAPAPLTVPFLSSKSQSAMRAIRYRESARYRGNNIGIDVAIRYACNKI